MGGSHQPWNVEDNRWPMDVVGGVMASSSTLDGARQRWPIRRRKLYYGGFDGENDTMLAVQVRARSAAVAALRAGAVEGRGGRRCGKEDEASSLVGRSAHGPV